MSLLSPALAGRFFTTAPPGKLDMEWEELIAIFFQATKLRPSSINHKSKSPLQEQRQSTHSNWFLKHPQHTHTHTHRAATAVKDLIDPLQVVSGFWRKSKASKGWRFCWGLGVGK